MRTSAALLLLVPAACGPTFARFETTDPNQQPLRPRPPGVVLDRATELPGARERGRAESSLLVLSPPPELSIIRETVRRFFRAVVGETPAELDLLFSDAAWLDSSSGRLPARNAFRSRFAQLDFSGLSGVMLYRERDLEIYRAEEARALAGARAVPNDLPPGDVLVRVRLAISHAAERRLFSDEVVFILRPEVEGLRIQRIVENTPVP